MADTSDYVPPKIWSWAKPNGNDYPDAVRERHDAKDLDG